MTGWALSSLALVALCFRARARTAIALLCCLPPLLLPTDSLPALIAMASVVVWHPSVRVIAGVMLAATVATATAIWRDGAGKTTEQSFWQVIFHTAQDPTPLPRVGFATAVLTAFVLVVIFAGVGFLRRLQREARRASAGEQAATQAAATLGETLAEADAREAIAQEVHDVIGHRLSMLAMQANVLDAEAEDRDDPQLRQLARQIREGAHGSMEDLRSLLTMLRSTPEELPGATLKDIGELVDECVAAGTPVNSSIYLDGAETAHPVVSRSAHRITAELLANVRKHAPGQTATLTIQGSQAQGIAVTCANPLGVNPSPGIGTNSGLNGIRRRIEALHGSFSAGVDPRENRFIATIWLPWTLPGRSNGDNS